MRRACGRLQRRAFEDGAAKYGSRLLLQAGEGAGAGSKSHSGSLKQPWMAQRWHGGLGGGRGVEGAHTQGTGGRLAACRRQRQACGGPWRRGLLGAAPAAHLSPPRHASSCARCPPVAVLPLRATLCARLLRPRRRPGPIPARSGALRPHRLPWAHETLAPPRRQTSSAPSAGPPLRMPVRTAAAVPTSPSSARVALPSR